MTAIKLTSSNRQLGKSFINPKYVVSATYIEADDTQILKLLFVNDPKVTTYISNLYEENLENVYEQILSCLS